MAFQPPKKRKKLDQGKSVSLKLFISIVLAVCATTLAAAEIASITKVTDSRTRNVQSGDAVIADANLPEFLAIVASVAAQNDRPDETRGDGHLRYVGLGFAHGSNSIDCRDCGDPSPSD